MSNRASIRRVEKKEENLRKQGLGVINLCGRDFRLGSLQSRTSSLKRCYASVLENCSGPISKEHYISENISEQLDTVESDALPWLKTLERPVAPKDILAANCLCKYHNEFLSPLDSLAGKCFENFALLLDPTAPSILVWGPSLSRWCLKVLVGLVGSKNVRIGGEKIAPTDLPVEWIEILFGKRNFPDERGLFMTPVVGTQISPGKKIGLATLILDGRLQGMRMNIAGLEFILSMADPKHAFDQSNPAFQNILHPPRGLNVDKRSDRIVFFWE